MTYVNPDLCRSQELEQESALFEALGASVVGASHRSSGRPCEDYFAMDTGANWAVAVVSDGAGSAARGRDGARIVSEEIYRSLIAGLNENGSRHRTPSARPVDETYPEHASLIGGRRAALSSWVEPAVVDGIENARERCVGEAREGQRLRSFHATVVGGVLLDDGAILFQIGDGGASAHRWDGEAIHTVAFSEPENGEFVNETFFFTETHWRQHLRFTEINSGAEAVWLMTDGAYELMVPRRQKRLRDTTVSEIDRLLFTDPPSDRTDLLATILSSPQAEIKNDDDKTLVIIRRRK